LPDCWAWSGHGSLSGMTTSSNPYLGFRFPAEVIQHAVWLSHCFSLSLRDVETRPAARGVAVSQESIREWGLRFGRLFATTLKRRRPRPGDKWHLDRAFIRIRGRLHHLRRAVDQDGHVLDILVQSRRSAKSSLALLPQAAEGLAVGPACDRHRRAAQLCRRKARSCRAWSTARAAVPTTGPRCRTNQRDHETGRCSGSTQPARRSASSRPTAGSTATSNPAAIARLPTSIVAHATVPFAPGARSPALRLTRKGQSKPQAINRRQPSI